MEKYRDVERGTENGDEMRGRGTGMGNWDGEQEWVKTRKEMTADVTGDGANTSTTLMKTIKLAIFTLILTQFW